MKSVQGIISDLQNLVSKSRSKPAILSEGGFDESSLMGTRDGYLNLAIAILQIVDACERNSSQSLDIERISEKHAYWSDNLKRVLHQLPGVHPFIVGCYLFDDHESFLSGLEELVDPTLPEGVRMRNDPAFKEP